MFTISLARDLIGLLITDPVLQTLAPKNKLVLSELVEDNDKLFDDTPHMKQLLLLKNLVSALDVETIVIPKVERVQENGVVTAMPYAQGMLILEMVCAVRNLCVTAAVLSRDLLKPASSDKVTISQKELATPLTLQVGLLQRQCSQLDAMVQSGTATGVELAGWRLPYAFPVLRQWLHTMALFSNVCRETILHTYVKMINGRDELCRNAIPSWEAAFEKPSDTFNEERAIELCKGKVITIVKQHNAMHSLITDLNGTAKILSVTPKLPHHEITGTTIALAMNTLKKMSTASVVAEGVDIIANDKLNPNGAAKAANFIKKYKAIYTTIPSTFWDEFEGLSEHAAMPTPIKKGAKGITPKATTPSSSSAAPVSTTPTKREAASSPTCKSEGGSSNTTRPGGSVKKIRTL